MKIKERCLLVISVVAILTLLWHYDFTIFNLFQGSKSSRRRRTRDLRDLSSYLKDREAETLLTPIVKTGPSCNMETCFDFVKCSQFKVYVYPIDSNASPGRLYQNVLNVIYESSYYTREPSEACLFVLSLDTLNRDILSEKDYVHNMAARIERLPHWNGGQNHIIFNLYSGTFPDYEETLGFDTGKAILAKASISINKFRLGFDISIPLFHADHPDKGIGGGYTISNNFPPNKKHLVSFKGKRYTYGIGSETRNSLFHLHNRKDIPMVTTCKHGKNWKEMKDERCDQDMEEYDK